MGRMSCSPALSRRTRGQFSDQAFARAFRVVIRNRDSAYALLAKSGGAKLLLYAVPHDAPDFASANSALLPSAYLADDIFAIRRGGAVAGCGRPGCSWGGRDLR